MPLNPEWFSVLYPSPPTGWSRSFKSSWNAVSLISVASCCLSEPLPVLESGALSSNPRVTLCTPVHRPSRQSHKKVPTCPAMGEDAAQAEKFQHPGPDMRQEKPVSSSPVPSSTPSPSLNPGSTEEAIRDDSQVNAVTVLTLLDKLVNMLDAVQESQHKMEQRQISLEGSVKGVQNGLTKLSACQASTGNTVSKLLEKSRKVSAHTRAVKERLERQCAQVKRLENNHAQLLRRNHFKVLIFQEENEIPASVFVKEPASSLAEGKEEEHADENKSLEETLHTVDLSSDDELPHDEEALEDSAEEKMEESRAEKIKRSSLRKVDSLKKAFSRQNIEKKMNKLGTKIVSAERREKIKKSLTSNHQKTSSGKSSPFKVSPLTFGRKKVREGESPAENETKSGDMPSSEVPNDHEESSFAEGLSEASLTSVLVEGKSTEGDAGRAASRGSDSAMDSNIDLTIVEDEEEESVALEQAQQVCYDAGYVLTSHEAEGSDEEPVQPAVLQVDQTA
ncbi:caveolae-associated protein 2 [Kogia breviceps]|uniref:caveolae-associated protein 2 n=1 Tax=Kogia breviceps TaxID=27615 RepID=UPI0034D25EAC